MQVNMDIWGFPGSTSTCVYMHEQSVRACVPICLVPIQESTGLCLGGKFRGNFLLLGVTYYKELERYSSLC